jgi:large subunit ribosomal protein L35
MRGYGARLPGALHPHPPTRCAGGPLPLPTGEGIEGAIVLVSQAYFAYQPRLSATAGPNGMPWRSSCYLKRTGFALSKMPKLKTKSGAKKRFKLTATGKLKAGVAGKRHRLISHNSKYIRQQRGTKVMSSSDKKTIMTYLPYGL